MLAASPLFAAEPAWYEDFKFWASFLTALSVLVGAAWGLAWLIYRERLRHRVREHDQQIRELTAELKELRSAQEPERAALERRLAEVSELAGKARNYAKRLFDQNKALGKELAGYREESERLDRNLEIAHQLEGLTWRVKPADDAPRFVPLSERRTPVVAVLNLKGGVGKTTVTANLAAAWARGGWRVLAVDLDLQASLTSLLVSGDELQQLARHQRLIQHYFEQAAAGRRPNFLDFIQHTAEEHIELVGSADTLAYAELNLTMRWLRRPERGDVRLLLRQALHEGGHARHCDVVLVDCPPVMNVSCVNALAAADYVLVPVMPNKLAADRVRPMIAWLRSLRKNLNHELRVLGVVANRIQQAGGMSEVEKNIWHALRDQCRDEWGDDVHMCKTYVPQRVDVRDAENERRPLKATDATFAFFEKLARELGGRLPPSSQPAALSGAV